MLTKTIEPILLKRYAENKIRIEGVCEICLYGKSKEYSNSRYILFPNIIFSIPIGYIFINNVFINTKCYKVFDILNEFINQSSDKCL